MAATNINNLFLLSKYFSALPVAKAEIFAGVKNSDNKKAPRRVPANRRAPTALDHCVSILSLATKYLRAKATSWPSPG